jgi:dTDP-4-dehydrorhamnose 3,5-epimerase
MKPLTPEEIASDVRHLVSTQSYGGKQRIDGLQIFELRRMAGEDGTFEELARFENGRLQQFPDFEIRQISRSSLLPGAIKAWHLHFNQEDVWYIRPEDHMLLGLWDVREQSPTNGLQMKIPMGAGTSKLVYIPRGVAHGVANLAPTAGQIVYFVNQQFNAEAPDERRLPWDAAGADFWVPEKA